MRKEELPRPLVGGWEGSGREAGGRGKGGGVQRQLTAAGDGMLSNTKHLGVRAGLCQTRAKRPTGVRHCMILLKVWRVT